MVAQSAPTEVTVHIRGETGTGKELVARALHAASPRARGPFVAVNCAAIPEHLLESDLFGHERGAFTGAVGRRLGRFERANSGTLFLDEIGDMPHALQAKILRAIQEREIERVGASGPVPIDVRIVTATNRDLEGAMMAGEFRQDLFYRLAVLVIELPPLRDQMDDLDPLVDHLVLLASRKHGRLVKVISDSFLSRLRSHDWPGNVRELGNVIERAVVMSEDGVLRLKHLPRSLQPSHPSSGSETTAFPTLSVVERETIQRALLQANGKHSEAALLLGIHRNALRRRMRKYGIRVG